MGIARKQSFGSEIGTEKSLCMISCILQSDKVKQEHYALNFLSCLNKGCDVASSRRSDSGARTNNYRYSERKSGKKNKGRLGKRTGEAFPRPLPQSPLVFSGLSLAISIFFARAPPSERLEQARCDDDDDGDDDVYQTKSVY